MSERIKIVELEKLRIDRFVMTPFILEGALPALVRVVRLVRMFEQSVGSDGFYLSRDIRDALSAFDFDDEPHATTVDLNAKP